MSTALRPIVQDLEYGAFRIVAAVLRAMPLDTASTVSGRLWRWFAPWNRRHRRADAQLARALPELDAHQRRRILLDMWENLGRVTAESLQLDRLLADPDRIVLDTPDIVASVAGRGCLILSLHSGNWEICVWPMTAAGYRPAGVYQAIKNPRVDAYVRALRAPLYPGGLYSKEPATARRLVSWLKANHPVGVLADQRDNRGLAVPFFGRLAPSTPLPATLAVRLGAPIIAGRVIRTAGARFRIEAVEIPVSRTGDSAADILETTARIQRQFEDWVRERPDQWMWGHRRWRENAAEEPAAESNPV
jgi:KDO2-lipid IV(A) lauroyltransferase